MKRKLPPPPPRAAYAASQPLYASIDVSVSTVPHVLAQLHQALSITQQNHLQLSPGSARQCAEHLFNAMTTSCSAFSSLVTELEAVLKQPQIPADMELGMDEADQTKLRGLEKSVKEKLSMLQYTMTFGATQTKELQGLVGDLNTMEKAQHANGTKRRRVGPAQSTEEEDEEQESTAESEDQDVKEDATADVGAGVEFQDMTEEVEKRIQEKLKAEKEQKLSKLARKRKRESRDSAASMLEGTEKLGLDSGRQSPAVNDDKVVEEDGKRARKKARKAAKRSRLPGQDMRNDSMNKDTSRKRTKGTNTTNDTPAHDTQAEIHHSTGSGKIGKVRKRSSDVQQPTEPDGKDSTRSSKKRKVNGRS
ncbi:hypothetical protein BDZ85DRAFT_258322 [Elsinoe ampelina]|uniref:Uncharacterized protein n=1 Tax=Elsinoe ampelina TaxID=302913 RepID=A0A6A6GJJ9_9PEZI|nr:hypothetical protein BDZ85DRAFT_258322 [Elsinoe ampelina]